MLDTRFYNHLILYINIYIHYVIEKGGRHFQQLLCHLVYASDIHDKNGKFNKEIFDAYNLFHRAMCTLYNII